MFKKFVLTTSSTTKLNLNCSVEVLTKVEFKIQRIRMKVQTYVFELFSIFEHSKTFFELIVFKLGIRNFLVKNYFTSKNCKDFFFVT